MKYEVQAFAAAKFAYACLRGLRGDAGVVECSFVESQVLVLPKFLLLIVLFISIVYIFHRNISLLHR